MLMNYISLVMANFSFAMFLLALLIIVLHKLAKPKIALAEIVYRWFILLPLGVCSLYAFFMHAFYPAYTADLMGIVSSPLQYDVAVAYLGFGLIAILSFNTRYEFRVATVIANTCWLWGRAIKYVAQTFLAGDMMAIIHWPSRLWLDITLPMVLVLCLASIRKKRGF
jgi:VanZ family protein